MSLKCIQRIKAAISEQYNSNDLCAPETIGHINYIIDILGTTQSEIKNEIYCLECLGFNNHSALTRIHDTIINDLQKLIDMFNELQEMCLKQNQKEISKISDDIRDTLDGISGYLNQYDTTLVVNLAGTHALMSEIGAS